MVMETLPESDRLFPLEDNNVKTACFREHFLEDFEPNEGDYYWKIVKWAQLSQAKFKFSIWEWIEKETLK